VAHLESAAYPVEDAKIPAKLNLFSQSTYIWTQHSIAHSSLTTVFCTLRSGHSLTSCDFLHSSSVVKYRWRLLTTTELLDGWECAVFDASVVATVVIATYYSYQLVTSHL
jgi:hypothetical protein